MTEYCVEPVGPLPDREATTFVTTAGSHFGTSAGAISGGAWPTTYLSEATRPAGEEETDDEGPGGPCVTRHAPCR